MCFNLKLNFNAKLMLDVTQIYNRYWCYIKSTIEVNEIKAEFYISHQHRVMSQVTSHIFQVKSSQGKLTTLVESVKVQVISQVTNYYLHYISGIKMILSKSLLSS